MNLNSKVKIILITISSIIGLAFIVFLALKYIPGKCQFSALEGTNFSIDGVEVKSNTAWLNPGVHVLSATKSDYQDTRISFTIKALKTTQLDVKMLKTREIQSAEKDVTMINAASVANAGEKDYSYISIEKRAIVRYTLTTEEKLLELPFLSDEILLKERWSIDRNSLFLMTVKDEKITSRLITLTDKQVNILKDSVTDANFDKDNNIYYLENLDSKSIVKDRANATIFSTEKVRENLLVKQDKFVLYNDLNTTEADNYVSCDQKGNCETVSLPGLIYAIQSKSEKMIAILLLDKFNIYDLSENSPTLIDDDVQPMLSWVGDNAYFITASPNCSITEYNFSKTATFYANDLLCDTNYFSVIDKKIYLSNGLSVNVLEQDK